jgi:hypothetical protein
MRGRSPPPLVRPAPLPVSRKTASAARSEVRRGNQGVGLGIEGLVPARAGHVRWRRTDPRDGSHRENGPEGVPSTRFLRCRKSIESGGTPNSQGAALAEDSCASKETILEIGKIGRKP